MDLDVKLTHKQNELMLTLPDNISWWLRRLQGTGLKFWRLETAMGRDWEGEPVSFDGRTLHEVVTLAKAYYTDK